MGKVFVQSGRNSVCNQSGIPEKRLPACTAATPSGHFVDVHCADLHHDPTWSLRNKNRRSEGRRAPASLVWALHNCGPSALREFGRRRRAWAAGSQYGRSQGIGTLTQRSCRTSASAESHRVAQRGKFACTLLQQVEAKRGEKFRKPRDVGG